VRVPFAVAPAGAMPVRNRDRAKPSRPGKNRIPASQARILVAEDHPLNQIYIRKLLDRMGLKDYDLADDGNKALEFLIARHYDIVLMDCHMPEKSGYDVARAFRDTEAVKGGHVPIVAVTANAMAGTDEKCFAAGMDDYISKPIDADALQAIISGWIELPEPAAEKTAPVNLTLLKSFAGGDRSEEMRFVSIFVSESEKTLGVLARDCTEGENSQWVEAAHKLKGGAAGMGAESLRSLCAQAQDMRVARASDRLAMLGRITDEMGRVRKYLADGGYITL
jgi:CheY-like chemotaxis protein/HPt (histidine-containing phosphotransfer) domain-containing protein